MEDILYLRQEFFVFGFCYQEKNIYFLCLNAHLKTSQTCPAIVAAKEDNRYFVVNKSATLVKIFDLLR
jgi:hypothetical protein